MLMLVLEEEAESQGLVISPNMSIADASTLFDAIRHVDSVSEATPRNRKRRVGQLEWRTVLNDYRKVQRQMRGEIIEEEDGEEEEMRRRRRIVQ